MNRQYIIREARTVTAPSPKHSDQKQGANSDHVARTWLHDFVHMSDSDLAHCREVLPDDAKRLLFAQDYVAAYKAYFTPGDLSLTHHRERARHWLTVCGIPAR